MDMLKIVPTFRTAKQLHSQANEALPMLGKNTYGARNNWWVNGITFNSVGIAVTHKKLKKEQQKTRSACFLQL